MLDYPDSTVITRTDEHTSLKLWLKILKCHNLIDHRLRKKLRVRFGTTLSRFDLMAQLHRHPEGLKMSDLSQRLMVTGGNITGLTHRLIAEGMGERHDDPADRRAFYIKLTAKGVELFEQMAAEHEQWVKEIFSDLSNDETLRLSEVLTHLKDYLGHSDK